MIIVPPQMPRRLRPARAVYSVEEADREIAKIDRQIEHLDRQINTIDSFFAALGIFAVIGVVALIGFLIAVQLGWI